MRPLKMIIDGSYYDTYIYSGRLYLWCEDGSIRTIDWDGLIENLIGKQENLKLALECGFRQSNYLYGSQWTLIFRDTEIRTIITDKFKALAERAIEVNENTLRIFEIKHQTNPIPFPHSDLTIYRNHLYAGGQYGVFAATCSKDNINPVSSKPRKIVDIPALGVSASYNSISLSAGHEGLYEVYLNHETPWWAHSGDRYSNYDKQHKISDMHSSSSRWVFYSIFSSSHVAENYLADFSKSFDVESDSTYDERSRYGKREFRGIILGNEIFNNGRTYSWGNQDKLCQVANRIVRVVRYTPWDPQERFKGIGELHLLDFKGDVVSGDSALFGFIIECDNGLVVLDSNLENIWIPGEPINWRVFPKSKFYENHLHIVYDDRLEILSFNDDYFVDQKQKQAGITYWESQRKLR